jgi:membrane-associated protease RseP (regulator of RpoE activity)
MAEPTSPADGPPVDDLTSVFSVYETRTDGDRLLYFGEPLVAADELERAVYPLFDGAGYSVSLRTRYVPDEGGPPAVGEYVLVAEPKSTGVEGFPRTNVILALATVATTLFVGAIWYGAGSLSDPFAILTDPAAIAQGWPFSAAVLGVVGIHELGHYVMSRYHDVDASLPYLIPMPNAFGTWGAVIKMKGRIPDREALFDIGVAGPLAGLVATLVVTVIGLHLPPVTNPWPYQFNNPPLLQLIGAVVGQPTTFADPDLVVNPVAFGGWIGMLLTFINLLPVGQLDGGHMVRAMLGERQETIAAAVPAGLFAVAGYLYFVQGISIQNSVTIWILWGLLTLVVAYAGPAQPISDEALDWKRKAVGVLTFVVGLLCFTPVPFTIV